jgi:hypothetical protein
MGALLDRVRLSLLVRGNGLVENFRNNSLEFYELYQKSTKEVDNIQVSSIKPGGFYFLHYLDDSNWMKWSPIFVVEYKKFDNKVVILAINFNFIPIEIRNIIFDKYITEEDFEKDKFLKVDYQGVYGELLRLGFEYALMEFNVIQIKIVHKISLSVLPRFLCSQHPKNVYDPNKLIQIWKSKIEKKSERHQEIMKSSLDEFYKIEEEISGKYIELKGHISRLRTSMIKYGRINK